MDSTHKRHVEALSYVQIGLERLPWRKRTRKNVIELAMQFGKFHRITETEINFVLDNPISVLLIEDTDDGIHPE